MTEGEYQAFMAGWLAAVREVSQRVTATAPPDEHEAATEFSKFQEKCRVACKTAGVITA